MNPTRIASTTMLSISLLSAATAPKPIPGWSSQTGYRDAETTVQKNIKRLATIPVGPFLSGQSFIQTENGPLTGCDTRGFCTDTAGGDGSRIWSAMKLYSDWRADSSPKRESLAARKLRMKAALNSYTDADSTALVDYIISKVTFVQAPFTSNTILQTLGIQKQCLEWALTTATAGQGKAKGYSPITGIESPANYRPGMGLYKRDRSHAMLIVDIYWDANGNPISAKVSESNYTPLEWSNPKGSKPWQRRLTTGREVTFSSCGCDVINYEK